MNLVVGASGVVGSEICRLLAAEGKPVRALVRESSSPEIVKELEGLGVEIRRGDLKDHASLESLCRGVDTVFSTATAIMSEQPDDSLESVDRDGQKALVDAAAAAGVGRFVFVSVLGILPNSPFTEAKLAVESHLRSSGMDFTILQASCFMDVWLSPHVGFDFESGNVAVFGDGSTKMGWVLSTDVARVAVAAASDPKAAKTTLPVQGPELVSPDEIVEIFEKASGRKFEVTHVPVEALEAQASAATHPTEKSFAALQLRYAAGDPADARASGYGRTETTVTEYARRVLGA